MTTNLNTLVTALYVKIDDEWADLARLPGRPPKLSHSELLCLAVMQAMLGFHCEARWLR
ncbi:IS982 family transposase, partial [Streptomyces sp. NPDC001275]